MPQKFTPYINTSVTLVPQTVASSSFKYGLLIGQRKTSGTLKLANNNYTQPNYYEPILLPAFATGTAAANYLTNLGLNFQLGINVTISLPAPTATPTPSSTTTLTWNYVPSGFNQLIGYAALSATISQTTPSPVSGQLLSASVVGSTATIVLAGTIVFANAGDSGGVLTLNGINSIQYPDPNASDPIALMVWDYYQTALSANSSANGSPQAYISIISDRDTTISPNSTPLVLTTPTATSVTGTTTRLTFTYTDITTLTNFGYLPTTALGATTITQTGDVVGTYGGYTVSQTSPTAGSIIITVNNVTGTFTTTTAISIALDPSANVFNYLYGINLYGAVMQFPVAASSAFTTYADFYNGIAALNSAGQDFNSNHYLTYGMAGNISTAATQVTTLPIKNNYQNILVSYPYQAQLNDVPYENTAGTVAGARISSCVLYMLSNGDAPYPPLTLATINHLPVSSISNQISYTAAQNLGSANQAVIQGWLPLAPNLNNVVQFQQSVTSMTTEPNTSVPDTEFRYTHIWDCVRYLKYQVTQSFIILVTLPNNLGMSLITPQFLAQFRANILAILYDAQTRNIVQNVDLYQGLVVVTQDSLNPNQVDASIPSQIIPQVNGLASNITVFSSLINFNNLAG